MAVPASTRLLLRGGQFALSLIALCFVGSVFKSVGDGRATIQFGSPATNFGLLMTWTSVLYAIYQFFVVEYFKAVPRATTKATMIGDGVMMVLLVIAGIVLASADSCERYESWGDAVRCGNLTAGMAFTFLSGAAYFAMIVLVGMLTAPDNNEGRTDIIYHKNATPKVASQTEDIAVRV